MPFKLTDKQHVMLELVADRSVPATPEIERYTAALQATDLITLRDEAEWRITRLGEAMLERLQQLWLH
jgi:hypothetical protein